MNALILIRIALTSLGNHIMRSLLTMLGIIIGVSAIIAVKSVGEGAKFKVAEQIQNLGSNFIIVLAGNDKSRFAGPRGGLGLLTLKKKDLEAIMRDSPDIALGTPGVGTSVTAVYGNQSWQTTMIGVNEDYLDIRTWLCTEGKFFTYEDVRSANRVAAIGQTVARELFGGAGAVGQQIRINKLPFTIVAVLGPKGKRPDGRDEDDVIFTPWTTMHRKVMGLTDGFSALILSAKSKDLTAHAVEDIRMILRQVRKLASADDDDFTLFSQDEIAQASDAAQGALNLLLLVIASISLLVGGIGIMNIMLVTVTERTKEIGIRLALGATRGIILLQFLIEAVIVCLLGGVIGLGIGVALAYLVGSFLGWPVVIVPLSIAIALGTSCAIGIFFGYYPARKASMMRPVDALAER